MRPIRKDEILDLTSYEQIRDRFRARLVELKRHRCIPLGAHMEFAFESRDTILFQIQERLRAERITDDRSLANEIEAYNTLLPTPYELSATLLIEYDEREERARMLGALTGLADHLFIRVGLEVAHAQFRLAPGQEPGRLPAVNYVRFRMPERAVAKIRDPKLEVSIESVHPAYIARVLLTDAARLELASDLQEVRAPEEEVTRH